MSALSVCSELGFRRDGHRLGEGADFQRHVHTRNLPNRYRHARLHEFAEALQRRLDVAGPAGTFVSVYAPCASVTVSRLKPVSLFVIVTVTPGMSAP